MPEHDVGGGIPTAFSTERTNSAHGVPVPQLLPYLLGDSESFIITDILLLILPYDQNNAVLTKLEGRTVCEKRQRNGGAPSRGSSGSAVSRSKAIQGYLRLSNAIFSAAEQSKLRVSRAVTRSAIDIHLLSLRSEKTSFSSTLLIPYLREVLIPVPSDHHRRSFSFSPHSDHLTLPVLWFSS